jgi:glycogen(starch) synthase
VKILVSSHAFLPSIGGLENVSVMLAEQFMRQGHEVKLVTQTAADGLDEFPFQVIRLPGARDLLDLTRWCEVFFQNQISLRTVWPAILVDRPLVVTLQGPCSALFGWRRHLARHFLRRGTCLAISADTSRLATAECKVLQNPYDDEVFRAMPDVLRDRDLVFCGRLVSDKGADILLKALAILRERGLYPNLSIIGAGPEEPKLRSMVYALALEGQVTFEGTKRGEMLARRLNAHHIMVAPSIWREPFGIVALEGIACGCVVVGSEDGGLKEAIGPCGLTFPNGDGEVLASRLEELIRSPYSITPYRVKATDHLAGYTKAAIAKKYLQIFAAAIQRRSPRPASEEASLDAVPSSRD